MWKSITVKHYNETVVSKCFAVKAVYGYYTLVNEGEGWCCDHIKQFFSLLVLQLRQWGDQPESWMDVGPLVCSVVLNTHCWSLLFASVQLLNHAVQQ